LRNRRGQKQDYTAFKRKIYWRIALITGIALITVVLLRVIARNNNLADIIVSVMQRFFNMSFDYAQRFYWSNIRRNIDLLTFACVAGFFVVLSGSLLSQFAKYFHEISDGLDALVKDNGGEIKLSYEMASMESKIKTIKHQLEKREQDAKLAEARKNDVVMFLAHDIKTPLTSVIGYLSLLDEAPDMPPEQKAKYIGITLEKASLLEGLVDEFFDITRYNLQSITLSKENIDLYYMLAQMTEEFHPLLALKGKQIKLSAPEDLTVGGDPDKLARVFKNILKNAVAYSADNSVIDISAAVSGDMVAIVFKNAGNVPAENLSSIFDKFYRLDSARSTDTGGAGLGLAIAKEIVAAHGGNIRADSNGGYIIFTVELPCF